MGFMERFGGVTPKKQNTNALENKKTFQTGFSSNALKRTVLTNDVYQSQDSMQTLGLAPKVHPGYTSTFDNELAFSNPVQFIKKYLNKKTIDNALRSNPNIEKILQEYHLSNKYNLENANSIIMSHLIPTAKTAAMIYSKMGHTKNEAGYLELMQAALLHDIGKVFIPSEILDKRGKLSLKEREIIELHNKLSYEILLTTNLDPKVAKLAYEHHNYDGNLVRTEQNQALMITDIYCALREKRSYKMPLSDIAAKTILYDMGTKGKFDSKYISFINS